MELGEYWKIVRRRWWLPLLFLALGTGAAILAYHPPITTYQASLRFTIGVQPDVHLEGVDPLLTSYQASEYIRDDFVEILHSELFARDVNAHLTAKGLVVGKNNITGQSEKQHRILSMLISWGDREGARQIAEAAADTLRDENSKYFAQLGSQGASVTIIDGPDVIPIQPGLRDQLDVPIRAGLSLLVGLILAFALEYLDDTVREGRDLEQMGVPIVGEIPRAGRR